MESYDDRLIYRKKQGPPSVNNGWDSPWSMIGYPYPMPSNVRPTISRTTDGTLSCFGPILVVLLIQLRLVPIALSNGNYSNPNIGHYGNPIMGRDADGRLEVFFLC